MSNYTKSTNFATKDNLTPGDPLKVVRGTEIDTEFNNIATAVATKTDNASAAITGGTITGITDLAVADGGTGASTAAGALNNLLPSQTSAANKYLQSDGTNASWDAVSLSTADITGTLPVANGGTGVTASTGTGSVVLSNSPTLVTPALGTPASGVATNLTGLPISTGVSGLGTGVATFLGTPSSANLASAVSDETGSGALVFANSPTLVTPALGTPSALVGTNITGTASGLTAGNVTTNANLTGAVTSSGNATSLGSFSSANLLGALTDETGTGSAVFATSPTLVTPILGTPTSATLTNATGLPIATGVSGLGTGVATFLATPSSANLRSALTDETGTGSAVFATSPTLVTPVLGTPTSGTLTNCTGLPNAGLVNSSITIGGTAIALGASSNALANDITIYGVTVGRGAGAVSNNTVLGNGAFAVNTSGSNSVAIGTGALAAHLSGYKNTAVGQGSQQATNSGNQNTSVGSESMLVNTTGVSNSAFGEGALVANISGSYNVALGARTLYGNLASNNVAVGYQASYSGQSVSQTTALGTQALYTLNTGTTNGAVAVGYKAGFLYNTSSDVGGSVFVGTNAGVAVTSGIDNTFIGGFAAYKTNSGSANTAIGSLALQANTSASTNTAVGYQAGYLNSTSPSNVYVGYQAGYSNTTNFGSNTFIGKVAGYSTTGYSNTFIGGNASSGLAAGYYATTGNNNVIIGGYTGFTAPISETGSNFVVLSDGAANIVASTKTGQTFALEGAVPNAGTGITFPATQSASSNANTLDDYEEGTWTPIIYTNNGNQSITYTTQVGRYIKIGRLVKLSWYIHTNTIVSQGTGNLLLGGGPGFAASTNEESPGSFWNQSAVSTVLLNYEVGVQTQDGANLTLLNNQTSGVLATGNMGGGSYAIGQVVYITSA